MVPDEIAMRYLSIAKHMPSVSAYPVPVTTWVCLGMTSRPRPAAPFRRRGVPREYGTVRCLGVIVGAPLVLPAMIVQSVANAMVSQTGEEA